MGIKVVKFGGSSLADAEQFRKVASIVKAHPDRRFVVASAPGKRFSEDVKVTDMLYRCYDMVRNREDIREYYAQIAKRYTDIIADLGLDFDISGELEYIYNAILHHSGKDFAASRGEYLNSIILAKFLKFDFIDAESVIFFREDGSFDEEGTNRAMKEELAKHQYAVVPGFYGVMPNGTIKTFSRGGSDITGSLVARAAEAELYENWTDVSGFLMADPRVVKNPKSISTITYRELRELSYMGATVLHEDAIFPVRSAGIPINIRNTNEPEADGTMIVATATDYDAEHVVTGIAGKKGFSAINIEKGMMNSEIGFICKVLNVLREYGISCEHIPSGVDTMSVLVASADLEGRRQQLLDAIIKSVSPDSIVIEDGLALLAVVGRGMIQAKGTAARVCHAISECNVNIRMIDQGSSELNIIIGVEEHDLQLAQQAIYNEFVK